MNNFVIRLKRSSAICVTVMVVASLTSAQFLVAQDMEDTQPVTLHDKFAEIGKRVPDFGGMFVNQSESTLYVYLLHFDPITMQQVDNLIPDVLGSDAVQVAGL